ncbi:MAG: YARHG domain-containing protein [Chitinophagaceae bacterium]|nr:YARHG domain-containing protein [Chitinophagaceae bacterium]
MKYFKLSILLLLGGSLQANDGVFYAMGNTLVPLKETTIQLKKEILNLQRKGDWMQVDIYFEFYNPGTEKELTVGFVTPPGSGDVLDEEAKHPFVKDFMVMAGDRILPYKIAKMNETGFKVSSKIAQGHDFVYHFTIKFLKGITVIRHSYLYKGGGSVEAHRDFDYRLTTGTTWANNGIDDFELNINMGDDSYFSIPSAFGTAPAAWQLSGIGRITKHNFSIPFYADGKPVLKMAYLRKGALQLRAANFKPTEDLSITFWNIHNEVNLWCEPTAKNDFAGFMELMWSDSTEAVSKLSDVELRLYRNLNYARAGYDFKDELLKKAFSKYNWYIPDPAIKPENIPEYYVTKDMMRLITNEEKKRKEKSTTQ